MARKIIRQSEVVVTVVLTEDQIRASKELLADEQAALRQIDDERVEAMRGFVKRRREVQVRREERLTEVRTGKAKKSVAVREEYDPADDLVHVVRVDDGEELSTRPPRSDERTQHNLKPDAE